MRNEIDKAKNLRDDFKVIEKMISIAVCKLDFYYTNVKTTYLTSITNTLLVPTVFCFKLNFVALVWINKYNAGKHILMLF